MQRRKVSSVCKRQVYLGSKVVASSQMATSLECKDPLQSNRSLISRMSDAAHQAELTKRKIQQACMARDVAQKQSQLGQMTYDQLYDGQCL